MQEQSEVKAVVDYSLPLILWFAGSWLPGLLFWPLSLVVEAPAFYVLERRNLKLARCLRWFSASFVVPVLSLLLTAAYYPSGRAEIFCAGLMPWPGRHLDPETRLRYRSLGCSGDPTNGLVQLPNNAVIYGLHALFGPPPGAYRGPYPSREQSVESVFAQGSALSYAEFDRGRFSAGGAEVSLPPGLAARVEEFCGLPAVMQQAVRAAVFEQRCLVLGYAREGRLSQIVLLDLETGKPFNFYYVPEELVPK